MEESTKINYFSAENDIFENIVFGVKIQIFDKYIFLAGKYKYLKKHFLALNFSKILSNLNLWTKNIHSEHCANENERPLELLL